MGEILELTEPPKPKRCKSRGDKVHLTDNNIVTLCGRAVTATLKPGADPDCGSCTKAEHSHARFRRVIY